MWALLILIAAIATAALVIAIISLVQGNNRSSETQDDINQLRQAVGFSAIKNDSQTLDDSTITIINAWVDDLGEPFYDASNGALNSTSGLFRTPVAGQYVATGHICFVPVQPGIRTVRLVTDAVGSLTRTVITRQQGDPSLVSQCLTVTQVLDLSVGTSVWLEAFQNSGSPLDVTFFSAFSIERVTHKI